MDSMNVVQEDSACLPHCLGVLRKSLLLFCTTLRFLEDEEGTIKKEKEVKERSNREMTERGSRISHFNSNCALADDLSSSLRCLVRGKEKNSYLSSVLE